MKKILIVVGVVIVAGAVWYLASPLFLNKTVDEDFPTLAEVENMSPEERAEIEDRMMEQAANEPPTVVDESMPETDSNAESESDTENEPTLLREGEFSGADSFHQGSGSARLYELPDGSRVLRFEDFSVTNGPDLRVLLSRETAVEDSDSLGEYVELDTLKGNQGNQNYTISGDIDVSSYQSVVIYCKPFHVVFATADLTS